MKAGTGRALTGAIIVAMAAAVDQLVRMLVESGMDYHQRIDILPFFALFRTNNTGIAFSMFGGLGAVALSAVALAVSAFVIFLWYKTPPSDRIARAGFALILGGAFGNLIDRVALGHVVDYFLFHTPVWSFAVFNLADSFITIGAGLVLFQEFLRWIGPREVAGDREKPAQED